VASRAELDHYHYLRRQTAARVLRSCSAELQREVHSILGPLGVNPQLSRLISNDLQEAESSLRGTSVAGTNSAEGVELSTRNEHSGSKSTSKMKRIVESKENGGSPDSWEQGLTPFLLRFGEGLGKFRNIIHSP
jgi:hypothetical protein